MIPRTPKWISVPSQASLVMQAVCTIFSSFPSFPSVRNHFARSAIRSASSAVFFFAQHIRSPDEFKQILISHSELCDRRPGLYGIPNRETARVAAVERMNAASFTDSQRRRTVA